MSPVDSLRVPLRTNHLGSLPAPLVNSGLVLSLLAVITLLEVEPYGAPMVMVNILPLFAGSETLAVYWLMLLLPPIEITPPYIMNLLYVCGVVVCLDIIECPRFSCNVYVSGSSRLPNIGVLLLLFNDRPAT